MSFQSQAISLQWQNNNMVLKRGASTLVIIPDHVMELRVQDSKEKFDEYFRKTALQNREARRLFEAWERKDSELLDKIHQEVTAN